MKKIKNKINNSMILFSIIIIIIFLLFMFITSGLSGLFKNWNGILTYIYDGFNDLYRYTYYGKEAVFEFFWIVLLIPLLKIFKTNVFKQKKENFFKALLRAWPILIFIIISLVSGIVSINSSINLMEVLALIILSLFIGLFEELLCRGWFLNELIKRFGNSRKKIIYSIIISSLVFGIIHIINFIGGQPLLVTVSQIIGATSLGIALGAIFYRTKNIWVVAFIHGFWDFSIFITEINKGTTCITDTVENVSIILAIFYLLIIILTELPGFFNALLLLGKDEINETLPEENQETLSEENKKNSRGFRKIIKIVLIIYLTLYGTIKLLTISENNNICPIYINKEVKNYSETIISKNDYNIYIEKKIINDNCNNCVTNEKYNYNFKIIDNKVIIGNDINTVFLDYDDVLELAVYENIDYYTIIVSAYNDSGNIIVYYSNYFTKYNVSNDISYLDNLKNSFNQILLPSVYQIGYYEEDGNNYKYPLFISNLEDRYILDQDGKIYKYRR